MKEILFVHSICDIGGIETFFIRLSRELKKINIKPYFLFLYKSNSQTNTETDLLAEARITYWHEISCINLPSNKLALMSPISQKKVRALYSNIDAIHVDTSVTFFIAKRIASALANDVGLMFGVYHANELSWSFNSTLPIYEKYFRKKVFSDEIIFLFFNNFSSRATVQKNSLKRINCKIFPLGVDLPEKPVEFIKHNKSILKIVSIGRLVSFKTYNLYMIDVIQKLLAYGVPVVYEVYGEGPLKNDLILRLKEKGIVDSIIYKGNIEYSKLDEALHDADLFIGSGTALLQAAANGIPSIIAIENERDAVTYGFFSSLPGIDYHEQNLPFDRISVLELILDYYNLTNDKKNILSNEHIKKSRIFNMEQCATNFSAAVNELKKIKHSWLGFYIFILAFIFSELFRRFFNKPNYSQKYDQIL